MTVTVAAIDSKFAAGKGASDIFQQIMSGMETQVRADLLEKFTKFASSLRPMTHGKFRRKFATGVGANKNDLRNADKLMVREDIPEPDHKAYQKALDAASREESRHKNNHDLCGYTNIECPTLKRLNGRWHRIYDQHRKAMNRYVDRKHLPLTAERMAEAEAIAEDVMAALDAARLLVHRAAWMGKTGKDFEAAEGRLVDETAEDLFETFINKQTHKTDEIINGRAGHVTGNVQPSIWQSVLHFVLADGARFEMRMKIVPKVSCLGNPFYQFPTTFHDAFTAEGEQVWASEENLKDTLGQQAKAAQS